MTTDRSKRPLKVRVGAGSRRSMSSKLWLDRQLKHTDLRQRRSYRLSFKRIVVNEQHGV